LEDVGKVDTDFVPLEDRLLLGLVETQRNVHDGFVFVVFLYLFMHSLHMFVKGIFSNKDILELSAHTGADLAIKMRPPKVFLGLFIIPKIDILEFLRAFMTNITLFMYHLKMPSELIDVIEELSAKGASGMEQNEVTVFAELALLDVALVGGLRVEGLL
jgi:hypothetical protein